MLELLYQTNDINNKVDTFITQVDFVFVEEFLDVTSICLSVQHFSDLLILWSETTWAEESGYKGHKCEQPKQNLA